MPKLSAPHQHLQRRIVEARRALDLSQSEVANQWGVPQQRLSRIETGERRLDVIEFVALARILDIDPHEVIDALQATMPERRTASKRRRPSPAVQD